MVVNAFHSSTHFGGTGRRIYKVSEADLIYKVNFRTIQLHRETVLNKTKYVETENNNVFPPKN